MKKAGLYRKGAVFEREIVNLARSKGNLAFRTAGSHSPIDVVIISQKNKTITLIQAKAGKLPQNALKREFGVITGWAGTYQLTPLVLDKNTFKLFKEILPDG